MAEKGYPGGKSNLTRWREHVTGAVEAEQLDADAYVTLAAMTATFLASGKGSVTNATMTRRLGLSERQARRRVKAALDSGWLMRTNVPVKGTASDYECSYPGQVRGIAGGYPAPRGAGRLLGKGVTDDLLSDDRADAKGDTERPKGGHGAPERGSPMTSPSTSVLRDSAAGAAVADAPSAAAQEKQSAVCIGCESALSDEVWHPLCSTCGTTLHHKTRRAQVDYDRVVELLPDERHGESLRRRFGLRAA